MRAKFSLLGTCSLLQWDKPWAYGRVIVFIPLQSLSCPHNLPIQGGAGASVPSTPEVIKVGPHQINLFTFPPSFLLPFSPLYLPFVSLYPLSPHVLSTTYENPQRYQAAHPCTRPVKYLLRGYLVWFISDLLMKLKPNDAMLVTHGGQAVPRDVVVGKYVCPGHGLKSSLPLLWISLLYFRVCTLELSTIFSEWILFHYSFSNFTP